MKQKKVLEVQVKSEEIPYKRFYFYDPEDGSLKDFPWDVWDSILEWQGIQWDDFRNHRVRITIHKSPSTGYEGIRFGLIPGDDKTNRCQYQVMSRGELIGKFSCKSDAIEKAISWMRSHHRGNAYVIDDCGRMVWSREELIGGAV